MAPAEGEICNPTSCDEGGNLSCQLTDKVETVYADAYVANAEKGDLFLCPATSNGVIGSLLGSLTPAQHFTHMGIFVDDRVIRQCTFIEDRLKDKAYMPENLDVTLTFVGGNISYTDSQPAPVHGFAPDLVRYGWPGTITLPIDDAIYGDLYGDGYPRCKFLDPDHPNQKMYSVHELSFSPVVIDPPTGQASPFVLPPLVVKPCTNRSEGWFIRRVAWEVANTAAAMDGHYRFYGYSDAAIALDPSFNGPTRSHPIHLETDATKLPTGPTMALVCSTFVWAAVEGTAAARGYDLSLDPVPSDDEARICLPHLRPLEGEHAVTDASTKDGLYLYDAADRLKAGNALYAHVKSSVRHEVEDSIPTAAAVLTIQSRAGVADTILTQTPFDDRVANQLVNTFGGDDPGDLTGTWRQSKDGRSVSPDDIFRFWDQTQDVSVNPPVVHGVYGHNEPAIVVYRRPEERPIYRWGKSAGKGKIHGQVTFNGNRMLGITVRLNCQSAVTGPDGYSMDVPEGRYRLSAGMRDPVSGLYASGSTDESINSGQTTSAQDIKLVFPTETRRQVSTHGHADLVDRALVGSDDWAHPDIVLRPLQIGPGMDVIWDPGRMVWPLPDPIVLPAGINRPAPEPNKPTRLGDWDYTESRFGFGEDQLLLRVYTELDPASLAANLIVESAIIEVDGNTTTYEVINVASFAVPKDGSRHLTVDLKSAETAPDRAHVELDFTNFRCPA
jgi:hypothetical protein